MDTATAIKNTLNLNNREIEALLHRIKADDAPEIHHQREHERVPFRVNKATLVVFNELNMETELVVATSNISKGGIAVLHTAYMYPKTRCQVNVELADGRIFKLSGQTVRCSFLIGRVHEIGIKFDTDLNAQ